MGEEKLKVVLLDGESSQMRVARMDWWRRGIIACGDLVESATDSPTQFGDVSLSWGVRRRYSAQHKALRWLVTECGFLGNRNEYLFIGAAGLNGAGAPIGPVVKGRGEPFYYLAHPPRKDRKEHKRVTFFGQVPGDTSLMPFSNMEDTQPTFYSRWVANLLRKCATDGMEIGFRAHPKDSAYRKALTQSSIRFVHNFDELGWSMGEIFEWSKR